MRLENDANNSVAAEETALLVGRQRLAFESVSGYADRNESAVSSSSPFQGIGLSIVLPAHNEEPNVLDALHAVVSSANRLALDYEVIVVDDGSSDRTASLAVAVASTNRRIKIIRHQENRGYGAALRTGFEAASKEFIFFTDADLQFDIDDIPKFLTHLKQADIVAGYRVKRQDGRIRVIKAFVWNKLVSVLFGYLARDTNCAFKVARTNLLRQLRLTSNGAMINAELLAKARASGYSVSEVGVQHFPRKQGTNGGASIPVMTQAIRELVSLRLRFQRTRILEQRA